MSVPSNDRRASYAATALAAFRRRAGDDDDWTSICDLMVDLGHLAKSCGLDFAALAARAVSVWAYERRHPDGSGKCPQVTIAIAGRRPRHAWSTKDGCG
jgi:hypothetical protein